MIRDRAPRFGACIRLGDIPIVLVQPLFIAALALLALAIEPSMVALIGDYVPRRAS